MHVNDVIKLSQKKSNRKMKISSSYVILLFSLRKMKLHDCVQCITLYSIITLFDAFGFNIFIHISIYSNIQIYNLQYNHDGILTPLKHHEFRNIIENGAFAPKEQMLHLHNIFKSIQNFT